MSGVLDLLVIDGSMGEGGGQILRTSLALSIVTQTPIRIDNIRAGRKKSGLLRQHLTCVEAAAAISGAEVHGAALRSPSIEFRPGSPRGGRYQFSIGSAGSTSLVLQCILPALAVADSPSTVELSGGTHNPTAPTFDFLTAVVFPLLGRMGVRVRGELHRPGFYPAGGGRVTYHVEPGPLHALELVDAPSWSTKRVVATVANLPRSIAEREVRTALRRLDWREQAGTVLEVRDSHGPGNLVEVVLECDTHAERIIHFGEKSVRAERVAKNAANEASTLITSGAPVGEHLADQLLLWIALAGGGAFVTTAPSQHTRTHKEVVEMFLPVRVSIEDVGGGRHRVSAHRIDAPV